MPDNSKQTSDPTTIALVGGATAAVGGKLNFDLLRHAENDRKWEAGMLSRGREMAGMDLSAMPDREMLSHAQDVTDTYIASNLT